MFDVSVLLVWLVCWLGLFFVLMIRIAMIKMIVIIPMISAVGDLLVFLLFFSIVLLLLIYFIILGLLNIKCQTRTDTVVAISRVAVVAMASRNDICRTVTASTTDTVGSRVRLLGPLANI